MKRTSLVGFLVLAAGCAHTPCWSGEEDPVCVGNLIVDLSGPKPILDLEDLGEAVPDKLWINPNASCDGGDAAAWELYSIPPEAFPVEYGVLPDGAHELTPAQPLIDGVTYSVDFAIKDGAGATGITGWSGYFTAGEAESFVLWEDACG